MKQKEKINLWINEEIRPYYKEYDKLPTKERFEVAVDRVYDRTEIVPENVTEQEDGWNAFRIKGVLDFSLIEILAGISTLLAQKGIGIFVVSTFNTDYVLVKEENFYQALETLGNKGYSIIK